MRAKANQLQGVRVGRAVDQDQVGLDVAIAVIPPIARQRMVSVMWLQHLIVRQSGHDREQVSIERCSMLTFAFAFVVALELASPFNRSYEAPPSIPQSCWREADCRPGLVWFLLTLVGAVVVWCHGQKSHEIPVTIRGANGGTG